jgi:hypothetical protein
MFQHGCIRDLIGMGVHPTLKTVLTKETSDECFSELAGRNLIIDTEHEEHAHVIGGNGSISPAALESNRTMYERARSQLRKFIVDNYGSVEDFLADSQT